jgi:hypothetical protein
VTRLLAGESVRILHHIPGIRPLFMRLRPPAGLCLVGLAVACSSSSTSSPPDAGRAFDAHALTPDAEGDARQHDAREQDVARLDEAGVDTGSDAASCTGVDAAISGFHVAEVCKTCIEAHCCAQAEGCAISTGCQAIEECATACVARGTAPMTCAVMCIEMDAGYPDGGQLSPSQNAAEVLDLCLAGKCSSQCS